MFGSIFPTWRFCWTTSPTSNLFEDWLLGLHYTTLALRSPTDFANFGRTKGLETHGAPGWPGTGSVNGENHGQLGTADLATLRRGGSRFLGQRRPPGRTSLRCGGRAVGCGEWEFSGKLYQVDEGFRSSTSTPRHWDDLVWMMICHGKNSWSWMIYEIQSNNTCQREIALPETNIAPKNDGFQ